MGLSLRYNLFHNTAAAAAYGAFLSFYQERGRPFRPDGIDRHRIDFYTETSGWVVVSLDEGWEWKERRKAQLFVSQRLQCPGLLVFVYDGDYWGYELFDRGEVLDHFVQESVAESIGFQDKDCRGKPEIVSKHLPFLRDEDIAPYLVQMRDWVIPEGMNVRARRDDEFRRFDECAVLDFLRMLGVKVALEQGRVQVQSPLYRSAFMYGPNLA